MSIGCARASPAEPACRDRLRPRRAADRRWRVRLRPGDRTRGDGRSRPIGPRQHGHVLQPPSATPAISAASAPGPSSSPRRGLVSVHFVNTSGFGILVAPHGGSDRRLSANPIAAGAPVAGRPPLILDIATSLVAEGKIQVARNQGEALEPGLVIDGAGRRPPIRRPSTPLRPAPSFRSAATRARACRSSARSWPARSPAAVEPSRQSDGVAARQQHDDHRLRSGGLPRRRLLRRRRAADCLDQGVAADRSAGGFSSRARSRRRHGRAAGERHPARSRDLAAS